MQEQSIHIKNRVHSAHTKLRDPESDALSSLNALLAFEEQSASTADSFCKKNFLHVTHLREMCSLRAQLVRTLRMPSCGRPFWTGYKAVMEAAINSSEGTRGLLKPPSKAHRKALSCCMASGWADQIAKRVRSRVQMDNCAFQVCKCFGGCHA